VKKLIQTNPNTVYILTALILLSLLLFIRIRIHPHTSTSDAWRDYTVLLIEEEDLPPVDELRNIFKSTGIEGVVGADSQTVEIFTYNGLRTVRLSELNRILEAGDTRMDPYLETLKFYFQGKIGDRSAQVFYLPEVDPVKLKKLGQRLNKRGIDFSFSEGKAEGNLLYWLFYFTGLLLIVVHLPKEGRILFAVGALIPLVGIVRFTFLLFILPSLQMAGWAFMAGWFGPVLKKHLNIGCLALRRDFTRHCAVWCMFSFLGVTLSILSGLHERALSVWGIFFFGIFAQALVLSLFYNFMRWKVSRQEHILFFPVPMRWEHRLNRRTLAAGSLVILSLAVLPGLTALLSTGAEKAQIEYPQPLAEAGGLYGYSWKVLSKFYKAVEKDSPSGTQLELPNLADYLTHRAYQEAYLYGRPFTFPEPGEQIVMQMFERKENDIIRREKVVGMFTENWYEDIITTASKSGVTRILLSQGGPTRIARGEGNSYHISGYTVTTYIGTLVFMFPIAGIIISKKLISESSFREKLQQKKGQKVA
jgi:hypothetical protein